MFLIRYKANCADEFDMCGMQLFETSKELNEHWQALEKELDFCEQEYWFGSNEFMEYQSFAKLFEDHTVIYINSSQYAKFKEALGGNNFGWMPEAT